MENLPETSFSPNVSEHASSLMDDNETDGLYTQNYIPSMFVVITYSHVSARASVRKGISVDPECENPSCRAKKRGLFWIFHLFVRLYLKVVIEKKEK